MKSKIKCIWQAHGCNCLTVEYFSGAVRYALINGNYAPYYKMTKTMRDFLENAHKTEYDYYTEWR